MSGNVRKVREVSENVGIYKEITYFGITIYNQAKFANFVWEFQYVNIYILYELFRPPIDQLFTEPLLWWAHILSLAETCAPSLKSCCLFILASKQIVLDMFHSEILASLNFNKNKMLSPGLENNHTLKCCSGNFPT